jgi:predicted DNA-binding transcriptional regulator YafY
MPYSMKEKPLKSTNMLQIYDRLRQSPVTLDVLHDWTKKSGIDVSRRTLYRYLDGLETGIKFQGEKLVVYNNEFNKKVWKIEFDESAILLNQFDINSYYILRNFIPQSLSGPREDSLKKLDELVYGLSSKSRFQTNVDANNMAFIRTNYIDASYTSDEHQMMEDMIWAIQHHRKIRVEEFNWDMHFLVEGFDTCMLVLPLKLLSHFGLMYLCVYVEDIHKICILPITNIIRISVTNLTFSPSQFYSSLDYYLDNTFGIVPNYDDKIYDIEIEFAGTTGQYITSMNWHKSQSFEVLPNENVLMRLHCGINREIVGFVMYFLNNAKVLRPAKLKKIMIEKLKRTLDVYEGDDELVYETNLAELKYKHSENF